jgi:glycogen debranching enzyme
MDNSPAWDVAFGRVAPTPTTPIRRSDTGHVDADMRPSDDFYKRVIALIDLYASLGWEPRALWAKTPFKVADLAINAILHRGNRDLLALAERFGTAGERAELAARLETTAAALARLWSDAAGLYLSFDLIEQYPINVAISAGFLPLWAGVADSGRVSAMAATLERWATKVRYLVPSTSPLDPRFEPKRYWRGPVWCMMNMMIAEGFRAAGAEALAARIKADTAALIAGSGFHEYFDPETGAGLGGGQFSWTASVALSWPLL